MPSTARATPRARALAAIREANVLLVYPIQNQRDPPSLWFALHPRTAMRWEWDEGGDDRVAQMWRLREELARSGQVAYGKWFRNRATFFSLPLFEALLRLRAGRDARARLSTTARQLLDLLEDSSPLSSKLLRRGADLSGKPFENIFHKALAELWNAFLIVGYGEVDDGAFPSLAIGASQLLFEESWRRASELSVAEARARVEQAFPTGSVWRAYWDRQLKQSGVELPA